MFGYFTFKVSSDEFTFFKNEMIRNYDEQKAANQSVHKQLVKTQNDLYYQIADINKEKASNYLEKGNHSSYLFYMLSALEGYTTCYFNYLIVKSAKAGIKLD